MSKRIQAVRCLKCGDIIISRARHDFHYCSCGAVAVDGGQEDYIRIIGDSKNYKIVILNLDISLEELYNDWEEGKDKWAIIKGDDQVSIKKGD